MLNHEKSDRSPRKYFTSSADGKDTLVLLFPTVEDLKYHFRTVQILLEKRDDDYKEKGRYISNRGTFKDHHP